MLLLFTLEYFLNQDNILEYIIIIHEINLDFNQIINGLNHNLGQTVNMK